MSERRQMSVNHESQAKKHIKPVPRLRNLGGNNEAH